MKRRKGKKAQEREAALTPGRVQVFVRIRPCNVKDVRGDTGKGAVLPAIPDRNKVKVVEGKTERIFEFDQVLAQEASNDEVYRVVGKPLVEACLTGMTGILMAYGQTGAGKTYTLMAPRGITGSVVNTVFSIVDRDQSHSYTVTCSYLQIYQERIYDLLSAGNLREVFLREHPKKGIFVERLSEFNVKCPEEISTLLHTGRKRLAIAETKMNRHSNRSHAICQIKVERLNLPKSHGVYDDAYLASSESDLPGLVYDRVICNPGSTSSTSRESIAQTSDVTMAYFDCDEDDDVFTRVTNLTRGASIVRGRLYICDLAGSERVKKTKAKGERLHEAQSINSSLLELGNVIHALAEGSRKHIPFRNSVLTRFLQEGLSGNSRTSLIVCVSPSYSDVNETLCSLKFGLRAMKVECTAQVNIEIDYEKMARQLAETLETKECEWRRLRADYEDYIRSLQLDRHLANTVLPQVCPGDQNPVEPWHSTVSSQVQEALKNQTKALLLIELISMELYYGMEDLLRDGGGGGGLEQEVPADKLYSLTDRDLLLHSAETLLELTEYFFSKSTFLSGEKSEVNNGNGATGGSGSLPSASCRVLPDPSYTGKLLRVRGTLERIKDMTDSAAIKFLSNVLNTDSEETCKGIESHKRQLYEQLRDFADSFAKKQVSSAHAQDLAEVLSLEQTLCHVLMDKALVNCILLLDKAEMERRMRKIENAKYDYSNPGLDPVLLKYRKKSEDGSQRLISVDEGVVLEGSESTNSREKLSSTPLESSSLAEMEAENRTLCENNARMRRKLEDADKHNELLAHRLEEVQGKLSRTQSSLRDIMDSSAIAQRDLKAKMNEFEFERDELSLKLQEYEDAPDLKKANHRIRQQELRINELLAENARLVSESGALRAKFTSDIEKMRAEETQIREDLCKKLNDKLSLAQEYSEALGQKILDLESKLRMAEQCIQEQNKVDGGQREDYVEEIKSLKMKLSISEAKNSSFCQNVREFEKKLSDVGKLLAIKKANEARSQSRIKELELECEQLRQQNSTVERHEILPNNSRENDSSSSDSFKDAVVDLETQLIAKDQEILKLKNEVVDLMSEVGKLDGEYNELSCKRTQLEKELSDYRVAKDEVEGELQHILKECSQLKKDSAVYMEENKKLKDKMDVHSRIIRDSANAVLSERAAIERDLARVRKREQDLESIVSNSNVRNKRLELDIEKREVVITKLQADLDQLLQEKTRLESTIHELAGISVDTTEENDTLQKDLSKLERNLSTLRDSLTLSLQEKAQLAEEMALMSAEADSLRNYASLCSEEVRSMQAQVDLYKRSEEMLQARVGELETSMSEVTGEYSHMQSELNSIEEERQGLEKRIQEASRAIDRVKMELLTLMNTVIALQKELLCIVDSILSCLGLDSHQLQGTRLRFVSSDSGYTSNLTETCSERSSESSDANINPIVTSSYLVPDQECLVNPSEISVIRENKSEIFRMHEELKIKLMIIKEAVDRGKVAQTSGPGISERELSDEGFDSVKDFPYLNQAERSRLTRLLGALREQEANRSRNGERDEEVYDLYSRLEGKLSGLSSQLASKEIEICKLLKEKITLHDQLMKSKYGTTLCEHCLNDPETRGESAELLRANLLTYMEETAQLEADIIDFSQYKAKLEKELNSVREQISALEDELGGERLGDVSDGIPVVTITPDSDLPDSNTLARRGSDSSVTASTVSCSECYHDNQDSRKIRPQKHVTFSQMDTPLQATQLPEKDDKKVEGSPEAVVAKGFQPKVKTSTLDDEVNSDDIDLCQLLEAIPRELPRNATEINKELKEQINRLSEYDNVDDSDKIAVVERQRKGQDNPNNTASPNRVEIDRRAPRDVRRRSEPDCRMCGLVRKKRRDSGDEPYRKGYR
ncbi:kinesin-related protein 8 isoform X1 [Nematostella vectensis]|uniref:kinesin-related protein 8 isoform X1 n=1 Tax=Nematostella vectensis TaxID=45351 RepID=UPI0020778B72|nr:kinesin-related protein 8 isoform X1 [Nematostella vectensis]